MYIKRSQKDDRRHRVYLAVHASRAVVVAPWLLPDLRVSAQVLFAAEEHPQLLPLILRKFSSDGDVETAQRLVQNSRGIDRTRKLAASHAQLAMDAVRPAACGASV